MRRGREAGAGAQNCLVARAVADGEGRGARAIVRLCHTGPMGRTGNILDVRVKLALLLAYSVSLFLADSLAGIAALAVMLAAAAAAARARVSRVLRAGVPAYVIAAFIAAYQLVAAGWTAAVLVGSRLLLLVWASLVLMESATATALTDAARRLLAPLQRVGVPVRDFTTALSIALRFMPLLAQELAAVRAAQASRGAALGVGPLPQRLRAYGGLMLPVLVGLFRRADRLACAMDARCFGATQSPTSLQSTKLATRDWVVLVLGVGMCVGIAVIW